MSAISVVWNRASEPSAARLLEGMLSAQSMYGSGDSFSWAKQQIALGGTLSRFLPEDVFDTQPLWSADGSVCMVADVRLDNRAELARELDLVHPEELADSSFLLAAWLRWGASCLDHMIGGFAFAVCTPERKELFAARDHAGERPLFYHRGEHLFALASMPKGLLALPGVFRGFDESQMVDWFGLITPDWNKSLFAGINALPLGHWLRVTPEKFECRQYWHPSKAAPTRFKRDEDYPEALLEILDRATEARLRTTKSVGSLLSAGLDCSSVTASAARLLAARGKSLTAFTSVPRPEWNGMGRSCDIMNEGTAAAEVAALYPNIRHVIIDAAGYDLLPTMKVWTEAWDQPAFNVINLLWFTAIIDRAKEEGINVILEGGAGNGTISWETHAIFSHFFHKGQWIKLLKNAYLLRKHGGTSVRQVTKATLGDMLPGWCHRLLVPAGRLNNPYTPLAHPDLIRRSALPEKISNYMFGDTMSRLADEHAIYLEDTDYGPVNAAIQGASKIEFRDPTGDKRIYDFCFSIPPEQYLVGGHSRALARRAMKGRLPEAALSRYNRGLQGADWYLAMQEALPALREEVSLQERDPAVRQFLDIPKMHNLLNSWPASDYHTPEVVSVWHSTLTRAISMGYFLRTHDFKASGAGHSDPGLVDSAAVPSVRD